MQTFTSTLIIYVYFPLLVLAMDSQYTQSNTLSFSSPVVDEERIRPNHWLCSVLRHW